MREIKFRAWDATMGRYYEPLHEAYNNRLFELMVGFGGDLLAHTMKGVQHQSAFTNKYELEQFTGLTDSDGVEIYEGDFVEFTYWWFDGAMERDSVLSGVITYEPQHMSFALRGIKNKAWLQHVGEKDSDTAMFAFFNFTDADFHVRGNIHENPELLEKP